MPTADTGRVQLRYLEEVTWGETPASAMTNLRATGESLKYNIETTVSEELRSDRQITDLVQVGAGAEGDINFELSHATFDDLLEAALYGAFSADLAISAATIDAAASDDSFNDSGSGLGAIVVGQWINVQGFSGDVSNNGWARVLTATAAKVTVDKALVDDAVGETVTINGSMLRNGTTRKSFTLEKEFGDVTQFLSYAGMVVGDLSLDFSAGSILTGAFAFMGKSGARAAATVGTGGATDAPTTDVMNAVSNLLNIEEDNDPSTALVSTLSMALTNNLRTLPIIGALAAGEIGSGRIGLTGNLNAYFEDGALYDKFLNNTSSSVSFRLEDAAGNAYVFTMPRIKWSDANIVAGGIDQDVMVEMTYQALYDAVTGCTLQIDSYSAP